jgi:hypothetical protein
MKQTFILLFLTLILSATAFSQMTGNYNYSIAARGFSIIQMPKIFNQEEQHYLNVYMNGGMVKFNDNQISYRLSGNYIKKNVDFNNDCINCDIAKGKVTDYAFKIGFEKNFNYSRVQPYFAFDLGYRNNGFNGTMDIIDSQRSVAGVNKIESTKNGITASPVIGIKINPLPQLTIFAESSLEFYYSYERRETVAQDATAAKTYSKTNQGEYLINPVSVGIQIHLGAKN